LWHKSCRQCHKLAAQKIPEFFVEALDSSLQPERLHALAQDVARTHYVGSAEFRKLAIKGLVASINAAFKKHGLTEHDDQRIASLCNEFGIQGNELGPAGIRFAKAEMLQRLDEGKLSSGVHLANSPIKLEPDEKAIWLFNNVTYYTMRNRTEYVGASSGISVRLMKGVYYRGGRISRSPNQDRISFERGSRNFSNR
jgi:hypothetical protein